MILDNFLQITCKNKVTYNKHMDYSHFPDLLYIPMCKNKGGSCVIRFSNICLQQNDPLFLLRCYL